MTNPRLDLLRGGVTYGEVCGLLAEEDADEEMNPSSPFK